MTAKWLGLAARERDTALDSALADLAASPLREIENAVVLERLLCPSLLPMLSEDATGFEALTNKIRVSDYVESGLPNQLLVQGVRFGEALADRLEKRKRPFMILLGLDLESGDVSVRFFTRREAQPWCDDDLEGFSLEGIMQWVVG
jgi:hypothetical protein